MTMRGEGEMLQHQIEQLIKNYMRMSEEDRQWYLKTGGALAKDKAEKVPLLQLVVNDRRAS